MVSIARAELIYDFITSGRIIGVRPFSFAPHAVWGASLPARHLG